MKIINLERNLLLFITLIYLIKSDLNIIGPSDLVSRYNNQPIEIVFGKISTITDFYVHGEVFLDNTTSQHVACLEIDSLSKNANPNEYFENFKIILAYNGQCSVVQKARNAQNAGASMLLLINNGEGDIKNVILEDDGSGNDIRIPIGLISLANGRIMENYIKNNPKSRVMVEINFRQKTEKKKVEFKLFFSSSEIKAYELIGNMTKYWNKFSDQLEFTPIYVIHQSPSYNDQNPQRELNCVTKGKYCYFPKENTVIQDGQRILIESLRQKCMYTKSANKLKFYFEYMESFYKNCINKRTPNFNERCSKSTLDSLGYPVDYLDECVAESFGVNSLLSSSYIDNENTIFKKDYDEILKYKITSFPAVVINDKPLEGIIKEYKIMGAICDNLNVKPDFCPLLMGEPDELINKKRIRIYSLILIIIAINILLFFIFRKYIMLKINEKINFNNIDIEGRINNFVQNYMNLNKNQEMQDYKSFDTASSSNNNKGYNKLEGVVSTV